MTPIYKYQKQKVIIAEELFGSTASPIGTIIVNIETRKRILVDGTKLKSTTKFMPNKRAQKIRGSRD